jgi:PadR family transcriptional regulator PadR
VRRKAGALVPLEAAILSAALELRHADVNEFHGYQLARHLADVSDKKLLTAHGTLYRALGRLERMELLESRWEDPQIAANENRPGRRLYELTGPGVAAAHVIAREHARSRPSKRARRRVAPA